MLQASAAQSFGQARSVNGLLAASRALTALVYRSRAVQPMSGTELYWLSQVAEARNRALSVTSLLIYDNECFYQWLEGPRENVARVMQSVQRDPRHASMEILDERLVARRCFAGWALKLAASSSCSMPPHLNALAVPSSALHELQMRPASAPILFVALSREAALSPPPAPPGTRRSKPDWADPGAPILQCIVRDTVVPHLLTQYARTARPRGQAWVAPLARRLIGPDAEPAEDLLRRAGALCPAPHRSTLIEPVSRALGDLWRNDECHDSDVAIGLGRLQTAMRLRGPACIEGPAGSTAPQPSVLVAPQPGENHLLGAALDADSLRLAGWAPCCVFPFSDSALAETLAGTWFDVLDLSLSPACRREHWLPRMAKTIAGARRASRNPALRVVVGGRVFAESAATAEQVGADAASRTAFRLDQLILRCLTLI